jgi:hypothetical protein
VHESRNFPRTLSGIFLGIFCHFLPFSTELSTYLFPQVRENIKREKRRRQQDNKRLSNSKHNRAAAKKKKKAEIDTQLAGLRRDLLASRASCVEFMFRVEDLEAEAAVLEAEKHELEADVAASKQKYLAKKHEADTLRSELEGAEFTLSELEDQLKDYEDSIGASGDVEFRLKAQADADADYEEETGESRTGGREHAFETREVVLMHLALGIAPSMVVPAMRTAKFDFKGPNPKLRWVQNMRKELRVAVCILAAATAADPKVPP